MTTTLEIEVIDQYGGRHRFSADSHRFEWRLKPGSLDIEGAEFLGIFKDVGDDEFELIATFPRPSRAGVVTDQMSLEMPFRSPTFERCQRCGFIPPGSMKGGAA